MPMTDLGAQQRQHQLYYEQIDGQSNRPCLVFLHEGLGSVAQWQDFPQQLCRQTGCPGLLYDRIGHGRSAALPAARTIHYLHEAALVELAQILKVLLSDQEYILVGHSDGGSIALISAAAQGARLRGCITMAAHIFIEEITLNGIRKAKRAAGLGKLTGLARYHGEKTNSLFAAWADTWLEPCFAAWNIEYLLPSIRTPLLVMQGVGDQYGSPRQVERIAELSGGPAQAVMLVGCGHAPHLEQEEQVVRIMADFVRDISE